MILLDENFPEDQLPLLRQWRVPFRQIGDSVAWTGVQDDQILTVLHRLQSATLFTLDRDFYRREFCHAAYGIVFLDVAADDAAEYVRRVLRHEKFNTVAKRLGLVARAHHEGLEHWRRGASSRQRIGWMTRRPKRSAARR